MNSFSSSTQHWKKVARPYHLKRSNAQLCLFPYLKNTQIYLEWTSHIYSWNFNRAWGRMQKIVPYQNQKGSNIQLYPNWSRIYSWNSNRAWGRIQKTVPYGKRFFHAVLQRLRENNLLVDSRYLFVEEQLGIFLYAISQNANNRILQDQFRHSEETISPKQCSARLTQLTCNYIRLPSLHQHRILKQPKFAPLLLWNIFFIKS